MFEAIDAFSRTSLDPSIHWLSDNLSAYIDEQVQRLHGNQLAAGLTRQ